MLWDLYQQYRIGQLDQKLDRIQGAPTQDGLARDHAVRLEEKLDRLALITRALFELMQESSAVLEERLSAKVVEIDLRDGQADGRMTARFGRAAGVGWLAVREHRAGRSRRGAAARHSGGNTTPRRRGRA